MSNSPKVGEHLLVCVPVREFCLRLHTAGSEVYASPYVVCRSLHSSARFPFEDVLSHPQLLKTMASKSVQDLKITLCYGIEKIPTNFCKSQESIEGQEE